MGLGFCGEVMIRGLKVSVREELQTPHYRRLQVTFTEVCQHYRRPLA